jgi:hypothetical protein
MFISSGSTQSALWGWNTRKLDLTTIPFGAAQLGAFSPYTLAPNGFLYAIPCATSSVTQQVLKLDPKTTNGKNSNYQKSTGTLLTSPSSPTFSTTDIYASKGILAPNGKIYFISTNSTNICIFNPGDSSGNNVSWEFFTLPTGPFYGGAGSFAGGMLGKDGKIYIVPIGYTALLRLDVMSGPSPVIEYSYYDATGGGAYLILGNCNSVGDVITFSPSTGGSSSITSAVLNYQVSPYYAGPGANLQAPFPANFMFPRTGLLNPNQETYITEVLSPTSFRVNIAPTVPLVNDGLCIRRISKSLISSVPTGAFRLLGFLDKFSSGRGESFGPGLNAQLGYDRFPVWSFQGSSQLSIQQAFVGGVLDPTAGSNKIFLLPGPGTQIFYIDPDNWNNSNALTTAKNLSFRDFGFTASPSTNFPRKFANISAGIDNNLYIYPYQNGSNALQNKIFKLDTQTLTLSIVNTNSDTPTTYTVPSQIYTGGTLPNGAIYSRATFGGSPTVYTNTESGKTKTYIGVNILANFSGLIAGTYPGSFSCGSFTGSFSIISDADNKRGKVVYDGRNLYYGSEFLSVKGFYDGVTNFDPMESDALKIPSNLADLPTSKYNIFCNRIL